VVLADKLQIYLAEQIYLLPPSLSDWLPENHLAYFISEVSVRDA